MVRKLALHVAAIGVSLVNSGCANTMANRLKASNDTRVVACAPLKPVNGGICSTNEGGSNYLLVAGNVLTPEAIFSGGGVLVSPDGKIADVGCNAITKARDLQATEVICPAGVISPGLINAHDHITYDWNPPSNWGTERYDRRNEWRKGSPNRNPITPAPQYGTDEQTAWSELRQVLSGTTSIAGSGGHKGFLRNLDKAELLEGLQTDYVYYNTFPLGDSKDVTPHINDCNYPKIDDPSVVLQHQCYLPHMAEGIDLVANNEIRCMDEHGLISSKGAYIHAVASFGKDGALLQKRGAPIIWSPRSNISLYGNTAPITMFSKMGILISLSSDWTPSGSMNLLRELKCADSFNKINIGSYFSDRDLWMMVTANPADALKMDKQIGRLAPGLVADIAIYDGSHALNSYRAILNAEVADVLLVLRGGIPLYGNSDVMKRVPKWRAGCEDMPGGIGGVGKTICVQPELGESFTTLQKNNTSSYPLFFEGPPDIEPTCTPSRPAIPGKDVGYTGISTADDIDGDGLSNSKDNCPTIFNPARPMDGGKQADCNSNGVGDACDKVLCK